MQRKKINKNKLFGILSLILGIVLICIGFFVIKPKEAIAPESRQAQTAPGKVITSSQKINTAVNITSSSTEKTSQNSINFSVNGKIFSLNFIQGDTFEKIIKDSAAKRLIDIKGANFSGLGFFVESINGIKEGNGYSWIYYINGKKATVGVSTYRLQNGDLIEWKYEPIRSF